MSMVVTGATGFVGRHLLQHLVESGEVVRALTRRPPPDEISLPGVQWVIGNLDDPTSWERLLEPGCTVINLAYSAGTVASDAMQAVEIMVEFCAMSRISRLVHCSTVGVFGEVSDRLITETTRCNPKDDYGEIKLCVERTLVAKIAGRFECSILRPTAVFGDGGLSLKVDIARLLGAPLFSSYFYASFFGYRRSHLVPVETVVAALLYVARIPLAQSAELFIVSEDDEPINNFCDVQKMLQEGLHIPDFPIPPLVLPRELLEILLFIRGRVNVNTRLIYSPAKLKSRGFVPPITFEQAIRCYARDQRRKSLVEEGG